MILLLDNYDSFVHNVSRYLQELGAEVVVCRSDSLTVHDALGLAPSHVVLSPGPRTPVDAGISVELVRALDGAIPVLGICLGHQAVGVAYGASLRPSPDPTHGRASRIFHSGEGILAGVPKPFLAGRYHSLSVDPDTLPVGLEPQAWTRSGDLMAFRHRNDPVWGVQFHPESILTREGHDILGRFLDLGGPGAEAGSRIAAAGGAPSPGNS